MAQEQDHPVEPEETLTAATERRPARRRARTAAVALAGVAGVAIAATWLLREDIADNVIAGELDSLGLQGRYRIVRIGPSEQVIRNLVIGNPARPDLTVEEIRITTRVGWGLPGIGRVTLVRPRLYGHVVDGRLSLGTLDRVIASGSESKTPFTMPDLGLAIEDGRALIDGDLGRIGVRVAGSGALRGGFSGELAAVAPRLAAGGCEAGGATLYGRVTTAEARPRFEGPLRLASLACDEIGARASRVAANVDVRLDAALDGAEGVLAPEAAAVRYGDWRLGGAGGSVNFVYRGKSLNARYDLAARQVSAPQVRLADLAFRGRARSTQGLSRFDLDGDVTAGGLSPGAGLDGSLRRAQAAAAGTLGAPLIARMRNALATETRHATLDANVVLRRSAGGFSLVVPRGTVRGTSTASLLALSRVQVMFGEGAPRVTGNFATGGRDMPSVSGRMESGAGGRLSMQLVMPEYRAADASLAVPRLAMAQSGDGSLTFTGEVRASGTLPGGHVDNLGLPVDGRMASNGDLALWGACTEVSFDALRYANLSLDRKRLTVCPARGRPILQTRGEAVQFAAGVPGLDLSGRLGQTPIRIASGPVGLAWPGSLTASGVDVGLGPSASSSHFRIARLDATVGSEVGGTFDNADIGLFAVPLDLRRASGRWRYADGAFSIEQGAFTLVDRQADARFQPLVARGASLRLADNAITARALLREPASDRAIVEARIAHDLGTARGHADLAVDDLVFDDRLQPEALSTLALGIVSNLKGDVSGTGRLDWNADSVTSRGRFTTSGLDFAAAFGPVRGLAGTVNFTDLLGLVTAPDQTFTLASVNPGIEVTDGTLSYQLKPGYLLQINGAHWPFMNGTLTLEPAQMRMGVAETRRYKLTVRGLDATQFVRRLELENLTATGVFDGELPLVFDEDGGRIEQGFLVSRAAGGSVSYIGELTYKDLSAMGNFAFDALKSVNYRRMEIGMEGALAGDVVTRISFDGLSQGAGARRNFLTKQVAKLPIRFVLNVRAPFFSLFGSVRSLYDPAYIADPRTLGLLDTRGAPRHSAPDAIIQPPASEKVP